MKIILNYFAFRSVCTTSDLTVESRLHLGNENNS